MKNGESINLEEEVHTRDEIMAVLNQQLEGKDYGVGRELSDEQGLYLLEIVIPTEDGSVEYSYMRKRRYPQGQAAISAIHVAFYDKEGSPVGGSSIARWKNREWNLTP